MVEGRVVHQRPLSVNGGADAYGASTITPRAALTSRGSSGDGREV
jgi:hypothetical protein